uniref:PIPK domain-containing protein n=1 Tax=Haptolina ericina TaxID=156174 RepID=A0A7S3ADD7_9EUKA
MLEFDQYYPVATSPACLCDFDSGHPGCACRGGVLSFMLQVGLIGGILFTCSLTHNLYRSVDDPFTRPSSRLPRYHVVNWCLVLLFSVPFLIPPSHDANHPNEMSGYGYQSAYQMCWSPVRYGPSLVNNFQMLFLATLPICTTWFFAPLFLCLAKRLLGQGGASVRSMLKQRERQVQQATFLLFVHLGHWFLVGLFYSCSALSLDSDPLGDCSSGHTLAECRTEGVQNLLPVFSAALCCQGTVHACAGAYVNRETLSTGLLQLGRRLRRVARVGPCEVDVSVTEAGVLVEAAVEADGQQEDDISESLRLEILSYTMRGIQMTSASGGDPALWRSSVACPIRRGVDKSEDSRRPEERPQGGSQSKSAARKLLAALDLTTSNARLADGTADFPRSDARLLRPHDGSTAETVSDSALARIALEQIGGGGAWDHGPSIAARLERIPTTQSAAAAFDAPNEGVRVSRPHSVRLTGEDAVASLFFPLEEAFEEVASTTLTRGVIASVRDPVMPSRTPSAGDPSSAGDPASVSAVSAAGPCTTFPSVGTPRLPEGVCVDSNSGGETLSQRSQASASFQRVDRVASSHCCKCFEAKRRYRVHFRSYAPRVWQWLRREVYGVDTASYISSFEGASEDTVTGQARLRELVQGFSEAKGGGFFFKSYDKRYMVKSLTAEEHRTLLQVLRDYCLHMREHRNSLITKIYGCYAITMYGHTKYFYVQDFLFFGCPRMDEAYDLKGSWIHRHRKVPA